MSEIKLRKGEPVERALKKLKKKMDREGTINEVRRREFYEKPSDLKYKRKKKAKFAAMMQARWDRENL
jgi:small subunit ribosomal protein S21